MEIVRYSSREPDADNGRGSFKPLLDGLVRAGVLEDDRPSVIGEPVYRWEKVKAGEGSVSVTVREV